MKKIIIILCILPLLANSQINTLKQLDDTIHKTYSNLNIIAYDVDVLNYPVYRIYDSLAKVTVVIQRDPLNNLTNCNFVITNGSFAHVCFNNSSYYVYPTKKMDISGLEGKILHKLTNIIFEYFSNNKREPSKFNFIENKDNYLIFNSNEKGYSEMIVDKKNFLIIAYKNLIYKDSDTIIFEDYKIRYHNNPHEYFDTIVYWYEKAISLPDKQSSIKDTLYKVLPIGIKAPPIKGMYYPDSTLFNLYKLSKKTKKILIFSNINCSACGSLLYKLDQFIDSFPKTDVFVFHYIDTTHQSLNDFRNKINHIVQNSKFKYVIIDKAVYEKYLVFAYPRTYFLDEKFRIIGCIEGTTEKEILFQKFKENLEEK